AGWTAHGCAFGPCPVSFACSSCGYPDRDCFGPGYLSPGYRPRAGPASAAVCPALPPPGGYRAANRPGRHFGAADIGAAGIAAVDIAETDSPGGPGDYLGQRRAPPPPTPRAPQPLNI